MNFDAWLDRTEASRIASEPILQRYFERPAELREPTEADQRDLRETSGRRIGSVEADEAALAREAARKSERDRRRYAKKRQEAS